MLIAQNDPELLEWLANAQCRGGGFLTVVALAALIADWDNYALMRPMILQLRKKYPQYEPSADVISRQGRTDLNA